VRALSRNNDNPRQASRPFDKNRDGFVFSEGSGVLVLEELENAKARGAPILAELVGYASTTDAFHRTAPDPNGRGAVEAMQLALEDARVNPDDVQYINAHGTSTPLNDPVETDAIKQVFGDHAYEMAISATKSMTGHAMGTTAAMEAAFTALSIRDQVAPPTMNLHHPDPECDLDYVPNEARDMSVDCAISNSFGFGGHNAVLVFKRFYG
jgi:3-oxoacyl-[acyl-carrier-protein] synthase II